MSTTLFVLRFLVVALASGVAARLIYPPHTRLGWSGTFLLGASSSVLSGVLIAMFAKDLRHWQSSGIVATSITAVLILSTRLFDQRGSIIESSSDYWRYFCI